MTESDFVRFDDLLGLIKKKDPQSHIALTSCQGNSEIDGMHRYFSI